MVLGLNTAPSITMATGEKSGSQEGRLLLHWAGSSPAPEPRLPAVWELGQQRCIERAVSYPSCETEGRSVGKAELRHVGSGPRLGCACSSRVGLLGEDGTEIPLPLVLPLLLGVLVQVRQDREVLGTLLEGQILSPKRDLLP